jgi:hypothetical protein
LRSPGFLEANPAGRIETAIAYGAADPRMPGFINLMGGPLTREQIDTLVEMIRGWEPLTDKD